MIGLNLFKRQHGADELRTAIINFHAETGTLHARQTELATLIENEIAFQAVGESDPKTIKALRVEYAEIEAKLAGRPGAEVKIIQALEAAELEERRAERLAKIAEARAWQKRMGTASDELIAAMNTVTEKLEALRKIDAQMPSFINEAKSSVAPAIGGWLTAFRYYVEPDAFGHAIGALTGQRALLDQVLAEIEAGVPSRADRRAATGLPA